MNYEVLEYTKANDIKQNSNTKFLMTLEYNLSSVYETGNSSYLIIPLNPFGKSLLLKDKNLLDKFIKDEYFPIDDEANRFFNEKQIDIINLVDRKEGLKNALYYYIHKNDKCFENISAEEIDNIYKILKKRRKLQDYKLNFIVLVGDFLITHSKNNNYRWGLLEVKQLLNPIKSLILVTDQKERQYFNIEERTGGKHGYLGMNYVLKMAETHPKSSNEFNKIIKVW